MSDPSPSLRQTLTRLPLLGPVLRIAAGIVRLPRLRVQADRMQAEVDSLPALRARVDALQDELAATRAEQRATAAALALARADLDALTARHAALDAAVQAMRADQDNLVQSVPVALRRITREVQALRGGADGPPPDAG